MDVDVLVSIIRKADSPRGWAALAYPHSTLWTEDEASALRTIFTKEKNIMC